VSVLRKGLVLVLVGMLCVTGFVGFASQEVRGDFTVMWAMDLPRQTYFIGETVTFTVTAFASTDPTLFIPGELAQVTIRNESLQEMYSAWITTNSNGSAAINWDIPITADPGNYTVILTDTHGFTSHQSIEILYNEETYWKTRVDLLQREIDKQYQYINLLFSYNKWLTGQVNFMRKNFTLMWIIAFLAMLSGLYNFMYVSSRNKKSTTGIMSIPSKALSFLGIGGEPPIYMQHEEVAQQTIPQDKMVPIYGRDFHCQVCAHKGLPDIPMTEKQLEEHIVMQHDKTPKKFKWKYRFARAEARQKKVLAKEQKKADKHPTPRFGTPLEIAKSETIEEKRKELLRVIKTAKALHKKGKLSDKEYHACFLKVSAEMEQLKKDSITTPPKSDPREPSAQKPELQRKARTERQLFTPSGISNKLAENPAPKTAIDELFERLNHEKVN
jgi:hypothetical protein